MIKKQGARSKRRRNPKQDGRRRPKNQVGKATPLVRKPRKNRTSQPGNRREPIPLRRSSRQPKNHLGRYRRKKNRNPAVRRDGETENKPAEKQGRQKTPTPAKKREARKKQPRNQTQETNSTGSGLLSLLTPLKSQL